jgi:hypothetical protein
MIAAAQFKIFCIPAFCVLFLWVWNVVWHSQTGKDRFGKGAEKCNLDLRERRLGN